MLFAAIVTPAIVMFSVMTASMLPILNKQPFVSSVVFGVVMFWAVLGIGNWGRQGETPVMIVQLLAALVLFVLSCWLYDNKYETATSWDR